MGVPSRRRYGPLDSVQGSIGVAVPNQRFDETPNGKLADEVMRSAVLASRRLGDPLSVIKDAGY